MNRKDILRAVEHRLQEGKSKQEIFNELLPKVKHRSELMQYIAVVPSYSDRMKYRNLNHILFVLLVYVTILKVFTAIMLYPKTAVYLLPLDLIVPCISIYFAIMIWNYRGNMYRSLSMLGVAGILDGISRIKTFESYSYVDIAVEILLFYLPAVLIIYLAYHIGSKAFPYYNLLGQLQKDKLQLGS